MHDGRKKCFYRKKERIKIEKEKNSKEIKMEK